MRHRPDAVMLFAAGFGTRMGSLTAHRPKPLVPVAGKALIDHAFDLIDGAGVTQTVVNLHFRGDQIAAHLAGRPRVALSWERDQILETGGGLRAALPMLGDGPVYTLNSDAIWTGPNPLVTLRSAWTPAMHALLLLAPVSKVRGRAGTGDFALDATGRISRGGDFVYLGAQIIDPSGLANIPERVFSLNLLWDRKIADGTAFGVLHSGGWCDVGHPEGILEAEQMLANQDV